MLPTNTEKTQNRPIESHKLLIPSQSPCVYLIKLASLRKFLQSRLDAKKSKVSFEKTKIHFVNESDMHHGITLSEFQLLVSGQVMIRERTNTDEPNCQKFPNDHRICCLGSEEHLYLCLMGVQILFRLELTISSFFQLSQ